MTETAPHIVVRSLSEIGARHLDELVEMYASEWWTETRTLDDVRLMLEHSSIVVAFADVDTDRLIGFARVVTDRVYNGTLLDVIVRADARGTGIGDLIMRTVLQHPDLSRLRAITLMCREDKVPFYERWGFEVRSWRPGVCNHGRGAEMSRKLANKPILVPARHGDGYRVQLIQRES